MCSQRPSSSWASKVRAPGIWLVADHPGAHHRLAAGGDHRVIRRAGPDRLVGQVVQRQEIGVAQHHAVVRIPQHERLRDGLDRVAQAQVGLDGLLDQRLLLGDVDGDADQVRRDFARLLHQLAARAQPHPVAVGVTHAEGVVDRRGPGFGELCGKLIEMQVLRMHQRIDLAEAQELVLRLEPEDREHRMRPEDAAAPELPVPQPAAAAVERGVDAGAHGLVDDVGLARARRLPVEGEAEDQHDEAGGGRQRDGERRVGAPGRQRIGAPVHDRDLALPGGEPMHRRVGRRAVGEGDLQHAGHGPQSIQWLRWSEDVGEAAAERRLVGLRHRGGHAVAGQDADPHRRDDDAVRIGQDDLPARHQRPGRDRLLQLESACGARPPRTSGRTGRRGIPRCRSCRARSRRSPGGDGRRPARTRRCRS